MAFQNFNNSPLYPLNYPQQQQNAAQPLLARDSTHSSSSAGFTGSSGVSANPSENNNNSESLQDEVKPPNNKLFPLKDPRVLLGLASLPGFYWEWKAIVNLPWQTELWRDPITFIAMIGMALSCFLVLYSILIAIRALPIYFIITSYATDGIVLVPSELRSQQSLRKAIPFAAAVLHSITSLILCKLLINTDAWDWHDRRNQVLVGLATQHAFCFLLSCTATLKEFASGWQHKRFYDFHSAPSPSPNPNYAMNTYAGGVYHSNAWVAFSLTPRSNHTTGSGPMSPMSDHTLPQPQHLVPMDHPITTFGHQHSVNHQTPYAALDGYGAGEVGIGAGGVNSINSSMRMAKPMPQTPNLAQYGLSNTSFEHGYM